MPRSVVQAHLSADIQLTNAPRSTCPVACKPALTNIDCGPPGKRGRTACSPGQPAVALRLAVMQYSQHCFAGPEAVASMGAMARSRLLASHERITGVQQHEGLLWQYCCCFTAVMGTG